MILSSLLASIVPALATCEPQSIGALEQQLHEAEDALRTQNDPILHATARRVLGDLPCVEGALTPALAARIHVILGADTLLRGDPEMARRHLWSAQRAGMARLDVTERPVLQRIWTQHPDQDPGTRPLLAAELQLWIDGAPGDAPLARPHIVQRVRSGVIEATEVRWPDRQLTLLEAERERARWAVADLELAWRLLTLRVEAGHRGQTVRLRTHAKSELSEAREAVDAASATLLALEARAVADASLQRSEALWEEIEAQDWPDLSPGASDLMELQVLRRRARLTLTRVASPGWATPELSAAATAALRPIATATYAAGSVHLAAYHADQAKLIESALQRPLPPAPAPSAVAIAKSTPGPQPTRPTTLKTLDWKAAAASGGGTSEDTTEDPKLRRVDWTPPAPSRPSSRLRPIRW